MSKEELKPVAYMWQHEETGNTGFITEWDYENGWEDMNPRLPVVQNVYSERQVRQLQNNLDVANADIGFYKCCALSGETPKEGSQPSAKNGDS